MTDDTNPFVKGIRFGLGVMDYSQEKANELLNEIKEGREEEMEDGREMVDDVIDELESVREEVDDMIASRVETVVEQTDLATKDDIERLEEKIDSLGD